MIPNIGLLHIELHGVILYRYYIFCETLLYIYVYVCIYILLGDFYYVGFVCSLPVVFGIAVPIICFEYILGGNIFIQQPGDETKRVIIVLIVLFLYVVPVGVIATLRIKMPDFDDALQMKQEFKRIINGLVCVAIVVLILAVCEIAIKNDEMKAFASLLGFFITGSCCFYELYVMNIWVVHQKSLWNDDIKILSSNDKSKKSSPANGEIQLQKVLAISRVNSMDTNGNGSGTPVRTDSNLSFGRRNSRSYSTVQGVYDLLRNDKSFNLFKDHLRREFSIEILLAYYELTHYEWYIEKEYLKGVYDNNYSGSMDEITMKRPEFPSEIPLPKMIYNDSEILEHLDDYKNYPFYKLKHRAFLLYKKYIENGANFEINIPYKMKNTLNFEMKNFTLWMRNDKIELQYLYKMYRPCIKEMRKLLGYSFKRYKDSLSK